MEAGVNESSLPTAGDTIYKTVEFYALTREGSEALAKVLGVKEQRYYRVPHTILVKIIPLLMTELLKVSFKIHYQ